MFGRKCPYCAGKNIYLKCAWPMVKYGCRDCDRTVAMLREKGLSDVDIKRVFEAMKK